LCVFCDDQQPHQSARGEIGFTAGNAPPQRIGSVQLDSAPAAIGAP